MAGLNPDLHTKKGKNLSPPPSGEGGVIKTSYGMVNPGGKSIHLLPKAHENFDGLSNNVGLVKLPISLQFNKYVKATENCSL